MPCIGVKFCTLKEAYKRLFMYGFSRDAQLQATVKKSCRQKAFVLYIHDVMIITNDQPWQISIARNLCPGEEQNAIAR